MVGTVEVDSIPAPWSRLVSHRAFWKKNSKDSRRESDGRPNATRASLWWQGDSIYSLVRARRRIVPSKVRCIVAAKADRVPLRDAAIGTLLSMASEHTKALPQSSV